MFHSFIHEIFCFIVYNIYDECGQDDRRRLQQRDPIKLREMMSQQSILVETADSFSVNAGYKQALNDFSCGAETAQEAWLAEPTVAAALHVTLNTPGMQYNKTATSLLPLYKDLMTKHQILIYSGDVDGW